MPINPYQYTPVPQLSGSYQPASSASAAPASPASTRPPSAGLSRTSSHESANSRKLRGQFAAQSVAEPQSSKAAAATGAAANSEKWAKYSLDSHYLFRSKDRDDNMVQGFFSPDVNYAEKYHNGEKASRAEMMMVTLDRPVGEVLIELVKSKRAFGQNAGEVGGMISDGAEVSKCDKKRVEGTKLQKDYESNAYKTALPGGKTRKNPKNAVMFKLEGDVVNVEVCSRLINKKTNDEVAHPLDRYIKAVDLHYK